MGGNTKKENKYKKWFTALFSPCKRRGSEAACRSHNLPACLAQYPAYLQPIASVF
jgi:hypothetical protein